MFLENGLACGQPLLTASEILTVCINQSRFTPITPTRRNPTTHTRQRNTIQPNIVQKATLYPSMRASGEDLSAKEDSLVTDEAMTWATLNPIAPPSWAHVLNTAPLRACMCFGKLSEMTRIPTVKRTSQLIGVRIWENVCQQPADGTKLCCPAIVPKRWHGT